MAKQKVKINVAAITDRYVYGIVLTRDELPRVKVEVVRCYAGEWNAFYKVDGKQQPSKFSWGSGNAPYAKVIEEAYALLRNIPNIS